jgi:hypothetical protein
MIDCSLLEESNKISNDHMKSLAMKERDANYSKFRQHITTPNVPYNLCPIGEQLKKEYTLLQGFHIDKHTCIEKKPEFNTGQWEKQHSRNLLNGDKVFNIQTKTK